MLKLGLVVSGDLTCQWSTISVQQLIIDQIVNVTEVNHTTSSTQKQVNPNQSFPVCVTMCVCVLQTSESESTACSPTERPALLCRRRRSLLQAAAASVSLAAEAESVYGRRSAVPGLRGCREGSELRSSPASPTAPAFLLPPVLRLHPGRPRRHRSPNFRYSTHFRSRK